MDAGRAICAQETPRHPRGGERAFPFVSSIREKPAPARGATANHARFGSSAARPEPAAAAGVIAVTCGGSAPLNFASIAAECAAMQRPARTDEQARTGFRTLQFGRAAARYDEVADVQREMAARLARFCPAELAPRRVLELGCGTGLFIEQLRRRFPSAWLSASDWSEQMLAACRTRMARLGGERIEYLVLDASGQSDSP